MSSTKTPAQGSLVLTPEAADALDQAARMSDEVDMTDLAQTMDDALGEQARAQLAQDAATAVDVYQAVIEEMTSRRSTHGILEGIVCNMAASITQGILVARALRTAVEETTKSEPPADPYLAQEFVQATRPPKKGTIIHGT